MASNVGLYAKAIAAAVSAGLTSAVTALTDGQVTAFEWTIIVGAFLVALVGVWAIPGTPAWLNKYGKMVTSGLVAVVASVGAAVVDGTGVDSAELLTISLALLSGLGLVAVTSNAAASDPVGPSTGKQVALSAEVKDEIATSGPTTVEVIGDEVAVIEPLG